MKNIIMMLTVVFSIVCISMTHAGESGGRWPTSLFHPLTGKLGGSYTATPTATFMDPAYSAANDHLGTDIKIVNGSSVYAIADGTILGVAGTGTDIAIIVLHEIAGVKILGIYGHVSRTHKSTTILGGQVLGKILDYGAKGSSGDHLHWGVFLGTKYPVSVGGKAWGWGRAPKGTPISTVEGYGWRDPVPFLRDMKAPSPGQIEVSGTKVIKDGDTSASSTDGTSLSGRKDQAIRFSFKIKNVGKGPLTISSCYLDDADSGFTITSPPNTSVPAGGVTSVGIEFRSKSKGSNYADVIILSNSGSSSEFDFEIKAKVN